MSRISMHINHNATPERILATLDLTSRGINDTKSLASNLGISSSLFERLILPELRWIGLISQSGVHLTQIGKDLLIAAEMYPILTSECLHFTILRLNDQDKPTKNWAYHETICSIWNNGHEDSVIKIDDMATLIINKASSRFGIPTSKLAFSRDSIRSILNFLKNFNPPVISSEGSRFRYQSRSFCSEISTLWAISLLYRIEGVSPGIRLFITEDVRRRLCQLLLLDQTYLNSVLKNLKTTTDYEKGGLFDFSERGGFGQWIMLRETFLAPRTPA